MKTRNVTFNKKHEKNNLKVPKMGIVQFTKILLMRILTI